MYLKAINLKGFKSFPDRTRLTFSPGVSVIVGPNGCGKSNVTDAVLWALGEQSPSAVRGQSMRDVIFAGGKGQSRRRFAEVEVVIDNSEGRAASEFSEISISRRIERNGDGEYRLNGARCRLSDILEALADTNMGREMHSVISQGRVEQIVSSKPKDRRMLIEEAAGLGKHRKRRHKAQLKLDRTRENLDRAHDVEREARSRLRPLKRQAEAAERTAKLVQEESELRAVLIGDELRERESLLATAEEILSTARERRDAVEKQLNQIRERRGAIEERIAAGEQGRRDRADRMAEASAALERVRARIEATTLAQRELRSGLGERQLRLEELGGDLEGDADTADRIAELETQIAKLAENRPASEEAAAAERRRAEAEEVLRPRHEAEKEAGGALRRATEAREAARKEAVKASERTAALAGELAAADAKLAAAAVEGEHEVLAGMLETGSGLERALSAALGERLRASVAGDLGEAVKRLESADAATRALLPGDPGDPAPGEPPTEGARRLLDLVEAEGAAAEIARRLLTDAWLVEDLRELPSDFGGLAVTVDGDAYDGAARELRRLPREGTDPALVARSAREELASRLRQREQTEERAKRELERAEEALEATRREHDQAQVAVREARRALDEATEEASRAGWLAERRSEREGEESSTIQRAKLEAELTAERRHAAAAEKARAAREADRERLQKRIELERDVLPAIGRTREALLDLEDGLERHLASLSGPVTEEPGGDIAAELRECSQQEFGLQGEFREASEKLTTAEVEASQLRSQREESQTELNRLAGILKEELKAAEAPLSGEEREEIDNKLRRLERRREQIGPTNPLAESEYKEAKEHVTELSDQRKDLEAAISELQALIRRIDKEITAAFEETFEATSRNFEEMIAELFPGGRGRLRRIELGPRAVPDDPNSDQGGEAAADDDEEAPPEDEGGVEIEVTPAGKSMRRLTLLSGGEKSLVALAFVFAVLMARPCPFYILDEVEAALDDINLDRFLRLVRRFAERSQFIVVTHQKRTMDAADVLYGISMGGDGVTKVVSRKLPREREPGKAGSADEAAEAAA